MEWEKILNKITDLLNEKLDSLKDSLKETELSVKQAPTAMESHSDTSRFQFGQVADNLKVLINKIEKVIEEIKKNRPLAKTIGQGSFVEIKKDNHKFYYFISYMGIEVPFIIDSKEFRVISKDAPIAKCLFGKKSGDNVEIKIPSRSYFVQIIGVN